MAEDKKTEQGEVDEPVEIAAEDAVGAAEQPSEGQQEREQAIVDTQPASPAGTGEPVAESEQRIAEATAPAEPAEAAEPDAAPAAPALEEDEEDDAAPAPRAKPAIPGADLEVDIVREGEDALRRDAEGYEIDDESAGEGAAEGDEDLAQPIADAAIDLAAGARYTATGKRKTAVARVILKPGDGAYVINGRTLDQFFPRATLQRNIRQPLETVGYETRMDVIATMHGGGVSAQAGALRHGISKALIDADPNLRSELKRRGFLTRDARVKERKKAGLKKARKRPQFSKR
jgi:small subunit ribosomal protein S9